jgi:hypothetical protein
MSLTTLPIICAASARFPIWVFVVQASWSASSTRVFACPSRWLISVTEESSSSAADAAASMLVDAALEVFTARCARREVFSEDANSACAVECSEMPFSTTNASTLSVRLRNSATASSIVRRRSSCPARRVRSSFSAAAR